MILLQTQPRSFFLISALIACAMMLLPGVAGASHGGSVVLVDDSDGTADAGGCGSNANKCNTIQAGVDHASAGQTVRVAAGTYNESVSVSKTLKLEGAQKGKDATTRNVAVAQESIVNGGFVLGANSIVVDGFIIQNNAGGAGVDTSVSFSGYQILNNKIRDNMRGITLNSSGNLLTSVKRNLFVSNNGPGGGDAIRSTAGLHNADISRNRFRSHANSAITLADAAPHSDIDFTRNESIDDVTMVNWYRTSDSEASRNTARGTVGFVTNYQAISLGGGNSDVEISRNLIHHRPQSGILLTNLIGSVNTDIQLERNEVHHMGLHGIEVQTGSVSSGGVTLDRNLSHHNTGDGIRIHAGVVNNVLENNEMYANDEHDAHDDSTGTGTAGTANTWDDNECVTDQPDGLCEN